ncbi:Transcription factor spt20, partial [Ascosphaera pollenicola]
MSIANKRLNSTSSASFPTSSASPSASNLNPYTQNQAHGKSMHSQASSASTARPRKNSGRTSSSVGMSTSTAPTTESSNGTKLRIMTKGVRNEGVIAVNGGEGGSGKEGRKVEEPCVKSTRYILKKYNHHPPSLTIHLHPSHFRFDGQDGSFPYTSEMRVFLKHVREGTVPHDMMEQLLNSGVRWYEDCLVVRIVDHKSCGKKKRRLKVEDKGTAATGDTATANEGDANKKTDGNGAGTGKKASGDAQNGQKGSTPAPAPSKGEEEEDDEEGDELEDKERERLAMTLNSIHNYNQHVAPSPYAPFPFDQAPMNGHASQGQMGSRQPSSQPSLSQQQPQPARPETSSNASKPPSSTPATSKPSLNAPKKPKVFTTVLHPTAQSRAAELFVLYHTPAYKRPYLAAAAAAAAARDGDAGGDSSLPSATLAALSAPSSHPQSPAPPSATAQNDSSLMPPPSKRQRMLIEPHERLEFEAKLINATAPAICLRLVQNAKEADALIRSLEPETNRAKPPSPKLRKRTVAELAADEAHAAEEEKYMLIMDERLDVPTTSASSLLSKSGITTFDSETGVSGFAFARFKALETIRAQHEENKKREQAERAAQEAERKVQQREAEERRRQVELRQAEEQAKQEEEMA